MEAGTAILREKGMVDLPDVSWLDGEDALAVGAIRKGSIALYCTHSDESYEPSDGVYSNEQRGSIYEVANALAQAFDSEGIESVISDTLHHPHDAGAYRRSRQTAASLIKEVSPDLLIDVHRDGIPDPDEYAVTIAGRPRSKIRLLVGRGNQNMAVNKELALTIKAVADRVYPGLIKDIYMGKGAFNQDLFPRSLLFECGTYTLDKERVLATMPLMADVIDRTLYGGVTGSAGTSDVRSQTPRESSGGITPGATDVPTTDVGNGGVGNGLVWVAGIFVVGLLGYCILSAGSWKGGAQKAGRHLSEMTGGLIGKKPEDGEEPPRS